MALIQPAPGVLGGCTLLTAVELICLIHLITCMVFVSTASSVNSVDIAGVRISGYMQCINAAWFLLGIPLIIIGGVGAVFRVESQLKTYIAYLCGTFVVTLIWLGIFITYGNACNTIQPTSGNYHKQALMVCQASNGMIIFWMLVLIGIVCGAIYLVWSMLQYTRERLQTELLRYQEPWQAIASLADDAAEEEAKARQRMALHAHKLPGRYGIHSQAPMGMSNNPLAVKQLSNQVPPMMGPAMMGFQGQGGPFQGQGGPRSPRQSRGGFC
jgi:hypothetical protein